MFLSSQRAIGKGVNLSSITARILLLKAKPEKNNRVEVDRPKQLKDALFPQGVIQGFKQISFNFWE